jgi:hypothetical protein
MLLSLLATVALALGAATSAADSAAYTRRDLERELPFVVRVDSSRYGYSVDLDTTGASGALGTLARANGHYVLYLTQNALGTAARAEVFSGTQRADVQRRLVERLLAETTYVRSITESVTRHRALPTPTEGAGAALPARVEVAESPVRTVSFRRVMDVAARFFYPDAVLPNGTIQSHVCVGINGVADMQGGRDLALEGFVYAAIFHDLLQPRYYVTADFDGASRLINAMDLSADSATRLQRAQGVMWGVMLQSEKLRQVVVAEYRRAGAYLPFRIADAPTGSLDTVRR